MSKIVKGKNAYEELDLSDSNNADDVEDSLIKDSVLRLASDKYDDFNPDEFVGAKLRNSALQNDFESEYKGVTISRKKIQNDLSRSNSSGNDSDSSADDDGDSNNSDRNSDGSVLEDESEDCNDDNNDDDDDDDDEDFSNADTSSISLDRNDDDTQPRKATSKLHKLDGKSEDGCAIYSKGSFNVIEDIEKGNAIRQQYDVWESLLECRIKLQKCLAASNRLPQKRQFLFLKSNCLRSDQNKISKTCKNLTKMLQILLDLQKEMFNRFPEFKGNSKERKSSNIQIASDDEEDFDDDESISSSLASGEPVNKQDNSGEENEEVSDSGQEQETGEITGEPPKKLRKLEDYSKELERQHDGFLIARNEAIQKWNDKTRVSSGRINSSNFSAFDQSTLKQIENILCDKERLIKRTQTKRSVYKILSSSIDEIDASDQKSQPAECDTEIFDDDDFYHKLLRDLIEQRSADTTNPQKLGRQWIELQKVRSKMKRNVDVKSTKGRRLRYTVHQKLVNFMAPIPYHSWTEDAETELFSSVFGKLKNCK